MTREEIYGTPGGLTEEDVKSGKVLFDTGYPVNGEPFDDRIGSTVEYIDEEECINTSVKSLPHVEQAVGSVSGVYGGFLGEDPLRDSWVRSAMMVHGHEFVMSNYNRQINALDRARQAKMQEGSMRQRHQMSGSTPLPWEGGNYISKGVRVPEGVWMDADQVSSLLGTTRSCYLRQCALIAAIDTDCHEHDGMIETWVDRLFEWVEDRLKQEVPGWRGVEKPRDLERSEELLEQLEGT